MLEFVNITNEPEKLLYLCHLITTFVPDIYHPVMIAHGTQGAGKSMLFQFEKSLVDHTQLDSGLNQPKDDQDLSIHALHNYVLFYDNLSHVSEKLSDGFSRTVTGSSFAARKLYTNNEMFAFKYTRPILINGVNQVVGKSDLLDRSLIIQLERIAPEKRKEPGVMRAEFEKQKPMILGGIFDTLVRVMEILPNIQQPGISRMTEFDRWGCAVAEVLGYGQEKFKQARIQNMQLQSRHAVEASAVGQAVVAFMEDKTEWSGEPAVLYGLLEPIWAKLHLEKPKDTPRFGQALNTIAPNLRIMGIKVSRPPRGDKRIVTITKTTDAKNA